MATNKKFKRFNGTIWEEYYFYAYDSNRLNGELASFYVTSSDLDSYAALAHEHDADEINNTVTTSVNNLYTRNLTRNTTFAMNETSNAYVYIDDDASAPNLEVGDEFTFIQKNTGNVIFVSVGDALLYRNLVGNPGEGICSISGRYRMVTIIKTAANEWMAVGALSS